jgi:hypothetical protein
MFIRFKLSISLALTFSLLFGRINLAQWIKKNIPSINIPISSSIIAAKGDTLFAGGY